MCQLTFWKFFQNQKHIYQLNLEEHTSAHTQHTNSELCLLLSVLATYDPKFLPKKVSLLKSEVLLCSLEETFTKQSENCHTFYFTDEADVKFVQHQLEKGQAQKCL